MPKKKVDPARAQSQEQGMEAPYKGEVVKVSEQDKINAELKRQVEELGKMVEKLTESKQADEAIKEELRIKLESHEASLHPETGPGPACEAFKIHRGEGLQLRMSQEPGVYEPVPNGLKVRQVDSIPFLVKADHPDEKPVIEGMVANCRSLYTEEYSYLLPKRPGDTARKTDHAHLCRKHAKVLLGISADQGVTGLNELQK